MIRVQSAIESTSRYSIFTLLVGCLIVHFYLYNVDVHPLPIELLFLGVLMQSASLLWLLSPKLIGSKKGINPILFMTCIIIFSFSMSYNTATRFYTICGADVQREIKDATVTDRNGVWSPHFTPPGYVATGWGAYKYMGALSITIFPMIVKQITGLDIPQLFMFFFPAIVALIPLFAFVLMRSFLGDSPITYLSTALMPQMFFFFTISRDIFRTAISMPALFLMIYCLSRRGKKPYAMGLLFAFAIVSGHYTLSYFSNLLLLSLVFVPPLFQRLFPASGNDFRGKAGIVTPRLFFTSFLVTLFWLVYITANVFFFHVEQGIDLVNDLLSGVFERRVEMSYVVGSPRGPIVTAWFDMQFALVGIGGLVGMINCMRGKIKNHSEYIWTLVSSYLIGIVLIVSVSTISIYLQVERIIYYYLFWLCSAMAVSLLRLLRSRFKVLVVIFLLLALPMNMILPDHTKDLMYHPASQLAPERLIDYYSCNIVTPEGKAVSKWMESYLPQQIYQMRGALPGYAKEFVNVDMVGMLAAMWNALPTQTFLRTSYPTFRIFGHELTTGEYANNLLLHKQFIKNGLWVRVVEISDVGYELTGGYLFHPALKITSEALFRQPGNYVVYSNDEFLLLHKS